MELVPGDTISSGIAFTGFWELHHSRRIVELARSGGHLLDVGANLGYFSLLWASARPDNTVTAFEASPRNIELLTSNVQRNGLERRISIIPKAAGRERGTLAFDTGPERQTGWGGFAAGGSGSLSVEVVRVDETVGPDVRARLLKVDIEGADAWALEGCERLLRERRVEQIWFEQNRPRMRALGIADDEAPRFLASVGYRAYPRRSDREDVSDWEALPA